MKADKIAEFLKGLLSGALNSKDKSWAQIREWALSVLKTKAIRLALLKILGATTGFKAWAIGLVLELIYGKAVDPAARLVLRKGRRVYEMVDGKIKYWRVEEAEESGSDADYDSAVDDLFK